MGATQPHVQLSGFPGALGQHPLPLVNVLVSSARPGSACSLPLHPITALQAGQPDPLLLLTAL